MESFRKNGSDCKVSSGTLYYTSPSDCSAGRFSFLIGKKCKKSWNSDKNLASCEEKSVEELARMLGGESITETVLSNAREMKEMAQQQKNTRVK